MGSVLTIVIGRPLIGINFNQRRREADFRYALVGLRDNAEAIALYGGERREEANLLQRLYAVVENFNLLIEWQRNLAFFIYGYDLLLPLVPFLILAPRVATEALTLKTPSLSKTLIRDLSFGIPSGEHLLIAGESGAGKTSMLRAIAGLWRSGSGRILRPPLSDIMVLPQRPYMILGSLR